MRSSWWKITDIRENKTFHAQELPLKLVPVIKSVDINEGHETKHQDVEVEVKNSKINLATGALFINNKPVDYFPNANRIILFKRVFKDHRNNLLDEQYFIGLINSNTGDGKIIRNTKDGARIEPFKKGVPVY